MKILSSWGIIAKELYIEIYLKKKMILTLSSESLFISKMELQLKSEGRLARIKTGYTGFPENCLYQLIEN